MPPEIEGYKKRAYKSNIDNDLFSMLLRFDLCKYKYITFCWRSIVADIYNLEIRVSSFIFDYIRDYRK